MEHENDHEVVFRDEEPEKEESAPPTPITTLDMDVIIRGWEEKFTKLTECLREVQLASERTGLGHVPHQSGGTCSGPRTRAATGDHAGGPHGLPAEVRKHADPNHATHEHATWDTSQDIPRLWLPAITSGPRRGLTYRTQHFAAHPECAHRGSVRQYGDTYGIRAQHVAAHHECAHRGSG